MRGNGKMDYEMGEANRFGQMALSMKVTGFKINRKAKENLFTLMGMSTKGIGIKIRRMGKEYMCM